MIKNILLTGASSRNGRAALAALPDDGVHVLAGTRTPSSGAHTRARTDVYFDWESPDCFGPALDGVDTAYMIVPEALAGAADHGGRFVAAAEEAGLARIVVLSARGVEEYPGHPLAAVEEAARASSIPEVVLKPNWFMQNFTDGVFRPNLKRDLIAAPGGAARISFVDVADVGACAARVLIDGAPSSTSTLELTGPESLTFGEVAERLSRAWGRPVRYEDVAIDDPALPERLGLPPMPDTTPVRALFTRVLEGGEAAVSADVERLLGRRPASIDDFARRLLPTWAARTTVATP